MMLLFHESQSAVRVVRVDDDHGVPDLLPPPIVHVVVPTMTTKPPPCSHGLVASSASFGSMSVNGTP